MVLYLHLLSIFYACFCVKPKQYTEVDISTPLKNDNYLNYEEVDIEALTTE